MGLDSLLHRPVKIRPQTLRSVGHTLLLLDDAEGMEAQLFPGEEMELTPELMELLRDQISTDEITRAYICYFFDETLGELPDLGLRARRGKGSSRERGLGYTQTSASTSSAVLWK